MSTGFVYPIVSFSLLDYTKIANGAYFIGFNLDYPPDYPLCRMDNTGTIDVIGGGGGTSGTSGTSGTGGGGGGTSGTSGTDGTSGTSGAAGTSGTSGVSGASSSVFQYRAKTTIQTGDPGDGYLIWNNATQTSSTSVSIDHLDGLGEDIDVILGLIQVGQRIIFQDRNDSTSYQTWQVNGTPTTVPNNYWTYPVTLVNSAGTGTTGFANNNEMLILVPGFQGTSGTSGTSGLAGTSGTSGTSSTSGTSGTDGTSGTSGSSGTSAPTVFEWQILLYGTLSNTQYKIATDLSFGGTITQVSAISTSGTGTLEVLINSTPLGGTANSVSSVQSTQNHSTSNTFVATDSISLSFTATAALNNVTVKILYNRT